MTKSFIQIVAGAALVVGLGSCAESSVEIVNGECASIYGSDVCTWATVVDGKVTAVGATIPLSSVQNAPLEGEMVFPPPALARISFPQEITDATGISHVGVNWEVHGHPPGPFLTPHFDFHFNRQSPEEIEALDCSDLRKPSELPPGYVLPDIEIPGLGTLVGLCVPTMGMHAVPEVDMNATELFGASMIVGFYNMEAIFVEPMVSRDKLLRGESFELAVPSASDAGATGWWPSGFRAEYDEAAKSYRFVFSATETV